MWLAAASLGVSVSSFAQPTEEAAQAAWAAVGNSMQPGPASVPLRDLAELNVPEGMAFVPHDAGQQLMALFGNQVDADFIGLVLPLREEQNWFVTVDYVASGHIEDDEARDWDADELLKSIKAGTLEGNKFREANGVSPIEVTGWIEKPAYDASNRRLIWSARIKEIGAASTEQDTVNYNTYVLGREGYISMDLITSVSAIESEKPYAKELLAATNFVDGKRYADFNASTDKVAAYGLAALVGGVAAKKLGLLAVIAAFMVKAWKLVLIGVVGAGAAIRKVFKKS